MKTSSILLLTFVTAFNLECKKGGMIESQSNEPTAPKWVDLVVTLDSLPRLNKTGAFTFKIVVVNKDGALPITANGNTLNYLRISFKSDSAILGGDTLWFGKVRYGDSVAIRPAFTPLKTWDMIYGELGIREGNWRVIVLVGYWYEDKQGQLQEGECCPSMLPSM